MKLKKIQRIISFKANMAALLLLAALIAVFYMRDWEITFSVTPFIIQLPVPFLVLALFIFVRIRELMLDKRDALKIAKYEYTNNATDPNYISTK